LCSAKYLRFTKHYYDMIAVFLTLQTIKSKRMVQVKHRGENTEKLNKIIEAAQRRFGVYGLEKTSMREIASDLGISKASLYYYFPDKEHLYVHVVEKEHDEFIRNLRVNMQQSEFPDQMVRKFVETRMELFRTFLNLSRFKMSNLMEFKTLMNESWVRSKAKEMKIISDVLKTGMENGFFKQDNPDELAELFIDVLRGLRTTFIKNKEYFFLDEDEYAVLVEKTNRFTEVFIRGILK
jgi:AcrR family transcriptional regulator